MGPLSGVKVIELAGIGPCPMCAMLLAEMGAEVIKIDRTTESDLGVRVSTNFTDRSRRSVAVNLKHPDGIELVLRLCEDADILIEGFRPGVMERLGLGPDDCAKRNQRLVFGRVTGWGQSGPLSQAAGHDLNYIALTGALDAIGRAGEPPTPPLNLVGDYGGGTLYLALGVVAALFEARQSGQGQVVDAAMIDGAASLMTATYALLASDFNNTTRGDNLLDSGAHFYEVYATRDEKFVAIAPIERKFYDELMTRLEIDAGEIRHSFERRDWAAGKSALSELFKTKTRQEWVTLLEGTDACFAPVLEMTEAPHHPHNEIRKTFVNRDGHWQPNAAPRFSRTPSDVKGPPAQPGEHTRQALTDWGVAATKIDELLTNGAVIQS